MEWSIDNSLEDREWDKFVENCSYGHHEQTSRWGCLKANYGWQPVRLEASSNGNRVAGVQILVKKISTLGKISYVCKGPVMDLGNSALCREVTTRLHEWARGERVIYQVIDFPYEGEHLAEQFDALGYSVHPARLPPSNLMTATTMLDLRQDLETLLKRMSQTKRRLIRKAMASGLTFREGTLHDVGAFRSLMELSCARRGTAPTPPQKDFFHKLWDAFAETGWMRLFMVEFDRKPVTAIVNFSFGNYFRAWKIGWSGEHDEKNPDEFGLWNCIQWAKSRGHHWFDFVWLDRDAALRLVKGERPSAQWQPDGMTFAKLGYGGEIKILPLPRSRFYHPLFRAGYAAGGRRLLASSWFARAASRLHRKQSAD